MLRCKLTAIGTEYNYITVIAQNRIFLKKKKNSFFLSLQRFGPDYSINIYYMKLAVFPLGVSFAVTGNL